MLPGTFLMEGSFIQIIGKYYSQYCYHFYNYFIILKLVVLLLLLSS